MHINGSIYYFSSKKVVEQMLVVKAFSKSFYYILCIYIEVNTYIFK